MSYRSYLLSKGFFLCSGCGAEASRKGAEGRSLPKYKADGSFAITLQWFCWFCRLDPKKPLPVCLSSTSNLNRNQKPSTMHPLPLGVEKKP